MITEISTTKPTFKSVELKFSNSCLTNLESLRTKLEAPIYDQDNDIIVKAYQRWGSNCIKHFKGDFAFALYDRQNNLTFAARDHMGFRHMYYQKFGDQYRFAKSFAELMQNKKFSPNKSFIKEIFTQKTISRGQSIDREIQQIPPGHFLKVRDNREQLKAFWQPEEQAPLIYKKLSDYIDHFTELLQNAISQRLRPTDKAGMLLSGGVDSGLVAAVADKAITNTKFSYTSFARIENCDERQRAQISAKVGGWHFVEVPLTTADQRFFFLNDKRYKYIFYTPTLFQDIAIFSKAQCQGVNFILSGFGADDVFAPGQYSAEYLLSANLLQALKCLRVGTDYGLSWPKLIRRQILSPLVHKFIYKSEPQSVKSLRQRHLYKRNLLSGIYTWSYSQHQELANQYGVQLIHPYFDEDVFKFALSLPIDLNTNGHHDKYIVHKTAQKIISPEFAFKTDGTNYHELINQTWAEQKQSVTQTLGQLDPLLFEFFAPETLTKLRLDPYNLENRNTLLFVLNLQKWLS